MFACDVVHTSAVPRPSKNDNVRQRQRAAVACCQNSQKHVAHHESRSSARQRETEQFCVQLPTSAVSVALPAFAAARRAAESRAAIYQHLLPAGRSAVNPPQRRAAGE